MPGLLFSSLPSTCWLPQTIFPRRYEDRCQKGLSTMKAAQVAPWEALE